MIGHGLIQNMCLDAVLLHAPRQELKRFAARRTCPGVSELCTIPVQARHACRHLRPWRRRRRRGRRRRRRRWRRWRRWIIIIIITRCLIRAGGSGRRPALSLFLALAGWRRTGSIARAKLGLGHAAIFFDPIIAFVDISVGVHACGSARVPAASDSALLALFGAAESHASRATVIAPLTVKHDFTALQFLQLAIVITRCFIRRWRRWRWCWLGGRLRLCVV